MMSLREAFNLVFGHEPQRVRDTGLRDLKKADAATDRAHCDLIDTLHSISARMKGKPNGLHDQP